MRKTKELDHHLKHIINNVPINLEKFETSKEKKITYYTGGQQMCQLYRKTIRKNI